MTSSRRVVRVRVGCLSVCGRRTRQPRLPLRSGASRVAHRSARLGAGESLGVPPSAALRASPTRHTSPLASSAWIRQTGCRRLRGDAISANETLMLRRREADGGAGSMAERAQAPGRGRLRRDGCGRDGRYSDRALRAVAGARMARLTADARTGPGEPHKPTIPKLSADQCAGRAMPPP